MTSDTPLSLPQLKQHAQEVLLGHDATPEQILVWAKALIRHDEFEWARRILTVASQQHIKNADLRMQIMQKRVLATYKDSNLHSMGRLRQALDILSQGVDLTCCDTPETLGLAGAIHKRLWEASADREHLASAWEYYQRGDEVERGLLSDQPELDRYPGINAAFVADLLAHTSVSEPGRQGWQQAASELREHIAEFLLAGLSKNQAPTYWRLVTLGEALFGLGRFVEAKTWLSQARDCQEISEWEFVTSARQLWQIVTLHQAKDKQAAREALQAFLRTDAANLDAMFRPKLGLALSGGGFRASFYHLGVLARLAELDMLRHVEVLSCVSGGSIVGAHYYLHLRHLLQRKPDAQIAQQDYVTLVSAMIDELRAGVQRNPRLRLLGNPFKILQMFLWPGYSPTHRLGELYESLIYRQVADGEGDAPRWLNALKIQPAQEAQGFHPRRHNWRRQHKAPELILNATTVNTGHNWQFTASWMGESPEQVDPAIDSNDRLRRLYYGDAPPRYRRVRLGHAVAASSCVPGLFEPLALPGLYPQRTVRLVDGGVFDNQGGAGLLEQSCQTLIISDASGQLESEPHPASASLPTLRRSNDILMERVRAQAFQALAQQRHTQRAASLQYVHLKQGLHGNAVDWQDCPLPNVQTTPSTQGETRYGIRRDMQAHLARLRTDLDAFSDCEAYALMASGYRAARSAFTDFGDFPVQEKLNEHWKFLALEPVLRAGGHPERERVSRVLDLGRQRFFRVFAYNAVTQLFGAALLAALLTAAWFGMSQLALSDALAWTYHALLQLGSIQAKGIALLGVGTVGAVSLAWWRWPWLVWGGRALFGLALACGAWVLVWAYLWGLNRLLLWQGRVPKPLPPRP